MKPYLKIKMKKGTSKRKRKITWKMIDEMMRPSEKKIDEAVQKAMVEMLDEFKQKELKK